MHIVNALFSKAGTKIKCHFLNVQRFSKEVEVGNSPGKKGKVGILKSSIEDFEWQTLGFKNSRKELTAFSVSH